MKIVVSDLSCNLLASVAISAYGRQDCPVTSWRFVAVGSNWFNFFFFVCIEIDLRVYKMSLFNLKKIPAYIFFKISGSF